mgnify:CR=1 FL=1
MEFAHAAGGMLSLDITGLPTHVVPAISGRWTTSYPSLRAAVNADSIICGRSVLRAIAWRQRNWPGGVPRRGRSR